jgi:hypothetical protein
LGVGCKETVHRLFGGWTVFVDRADQNWLELISGDCLGKAQNVVFLLPYFQQSPLSLQSEWLLCPFNRQLG